MITQADLQEAIAECIGERYPNANTCIKLAAYYTILDNLYPEEDPPQQYSFASEPVEKVIYQSDTEFSKAIQGKAMEDVLSLMDELMSIISGMIPGLYNSVMNRLKE